MLYCLLQQERFFSVGQRKHIKGILAYWTENGLTSAGMEGFNNKVRWLIRQAYGYWDDEYFRLKIFHLPDIKIYKEL